MSATATSVFTMAVFLQKKQNMQLPFCSKFVKNTKPSTGIISKFVAFAVLNLLKFLILYLDFKWAICEDKVNNFFIVQFNPS